MGEVDDPRGVAKQFVGVGVAEGICEGEDGDEHHGGLDKLHGIFGPDSDELGWRVNFGTKCRERRKIVESLIPRGLGQVIGST